MQLDLFGAPSAPAPKMRDAAFGATDTCMPTAAHVMEEQLDLFVHTPLDQALVALRRALLLGDLESARQQLAFAQSVTTDEHALLHATAAVAQVGGDITHDSHFTHWQWFQAHREGILQFLGADGENIITAQLESFARTPAFLLFNPTCAQAYAPRIWFDLQAYTAAEAALAQDPGWQVCPSRLSLACDIALRNGTPEAAFERILRLCLNQPDQAEIWLSGSAYFAAAWERFCDLDEPQSVALFPGFVSLTQLAWPEPSIDVQHAGVSLLKAARRLRAEPNSATCRLAVKALNPTIFAYWLAKLMRN